jgi:hypothetical protein
MGAAGEQRGFPHPQPPLASPSAQQAIAGRDLTKESDLVLNMLEEFGCERRACACKK